MWNVQPNQICRSHNHQRLRLRRRNKYITSWISVRVFHAVIRSNNKVMHIACSIPKRRTNHIDSRADAARFTQIPQDLLCCTRQYSG